MIAWVVALWGDGFDAGWGGVSCGLVGGGGWWVVCGELWFSGWWWLLMLGWGVIVEV